MQVALVLCLTIASLAAAGPTRFNLLNPGFRPSRYTSVDLGAVNFDGNLRSSGHKEFITVKDNDWSGEQEVYRLIGVAPPHAVRGGAATTYASRSSHSVPIYAELDDENSALIRYLVDDAKRQASFRSGSAGPINVRAEAAVSGNTFAVLLDD
ncbi:uncharacterized protein LOC108681371 [Hyalella azteca]|uniref:Uncharacterized protein LOC108681371 n=1 Tax=Hyalella azteca TaxID=294128 RepID=A0A8B7PKA6_HYAAZ|nr:uncharacterized protein LOC108681371 [Hyalella azteca]